MEEKIDISVLHCSRRWIRIAWFRRDEKEREGYFIFLMM
jgi:hypothetical protein